MRRGRTGALNALETQRAGPKQVKNVEQATQKIRRMEERLAHLEKRARGLRKERDHLTLGNREALGIIRRRVGAEPGAPAKKNAMRTKGAGTSILRNGKRHKPVWAQSVPLAR